MSIRQVSTRLIHSVATRRRGTVLVAAAIAAAVVPAVSAEAATIVPVSRDDLGAVQLSEAMLADTSALEAARFLTIPPTGAPHGISDALSFFPTNDTNFGIMSTGDAEIADDDNLSDSDGPDLGGLPVRGDTDFDVSVLELNLTVPSGRNCLKFDFAFYSEEFPEYVGSEFNDAFIAEIDDSNWTTAGSSISAPNNFAFDPTGAPITVNSTGSTSMSELNAAGTTYDGGSVLLEATTPIEPGLHRLYLSIFDQGDNIYDSAAFVDNIRFETAEPSPIPGAGGLLGCAPGARPHETNPLVFLPGIMGSSLYKDGAEIWPREFEALNQLDDEWMLELRLAADGSTEWDGGNAAEARDIVRQADLPGPWNANGYLPAIEYLEANGYTEGDDFFVFPFDWRKSADVNGGSLITRIDQILAQTGAEQVDIMSHSQGGLVTMSALENPASFGKVGRVLTLGTPVLGAPKALGHLMYQMPCVADVPVLGCVIDSTTAEEAITNLPGFYELLPSRDFHRAENSPLSRDRDTDGDGASEGELTYDEWSGEVAAARNAGIMNRADEFHSRIDNFAPADPSVVFYRVVGDSNATIDYIREYETESCFLFFFSCDMVPTAELIYNNGDGTVPLHSADVYNPGLGYDARAGIPNAYAHGVSHGALPTEEAVLDFALAYFGNVAQPSAATASVASAPTEFTTSAATVDSSTSSRREPQRGTKMLASASSLADSASISEEPIQLAEAASVGDEPVPFGGIELESLGPVTGFVQDGDGNDLGYAPGLPGGTYIQNIAGGSFTEVLATKSYFLNEDGAFTGHLTATEEGQVRLRVRTYATDSMNGQAVFQMQLTEGAQLTLPFGSGTALADLLLGIDDDGDGTIDREIAPDSFVTGPTAADTAPPVTTATGETNDGGQVNVSLDADDGPSGSGVATTYYAFEGTQTAHEYTGPFAASPDDTVMFRSIDNAGNMEDIRSVLVSDLLVTDDAPNTRSSAAAIGDGDHLQRYIAPVDDADWFRFDTNGGHKYRVKLLGLPADYDVALYDSNGELLESPERRGKESEEIRLQLLEGTYYVRVVGHAGAWSDTHHYQLMLQTLGN